MRTLLASVSAIAVVLWTVYAGVHGPPEPREPEISGHPAGKMTSTTTDAAEHSDLPSRTEQVQTEHEPKTSGEAKASDGAAPSASSNKAASGAPPAIKDDPQASMKAEDAAPESCMPIGITVSGKLVFPMRCQELLARNRGSGDVERSPLANSNPPALAPKEDQQAESPKSLAEGSVTQQPTEPSVSDANAKLEDRPLAGAAKSGKGRAEADVEPGRKLETRNVQKAKRDGAMFIVRTIFPRWSP
jgi:hypothetical protein